MAGKQVLKDKKIVIYKKLSYRDAEGFPVDGYMPDGRKTGSKG
nr:MAG TPA: hypothetical protein [Caudoviricetes sp.]